MAEFTSSELFQALKVVGPDTWQTVAKLVAAGESVLRRGTYDESFLHVLGAPRPAGQHAYVLPIVYQLSRAGLDFNTVDREGNTPLHICALNDVHHSLVAAMIRCGADPCQLNKDEQDPLDLSASEAARATLELLDPGIWRSVEEGNEGKVQQFLESFSKITLERDSKKLMTVAGELKEPEVKSYLQKNKQRVKFAHACLAGDSDAVKELLEKGPDANMADPHHIREDSMRITWPLFAELIESNLIPVAELLVKKVDPNVMLDVSYGNQQPLFMWAIDATRQPLPKSILKPLFKKADVSKVPRVCDLLYKLWNRDIDKALVDILFPDGIPIGSRDQNGYTLRELIFLENINEDDSEKLKNELYYVDKVVIEWAKEGKKEKLEELVYQSYEYINVTNLKGKTVSALAKKNEQKGVVKFLKTVDKSQGDLREMMLGLESANLQRTKDLLNDDTIKCKDRGYRSPLHIAVLYERKYCVRHILQTFPQAVHFTDLFGRTPLHYACTMTGGAEFQKMLMKARGDNTSKDVYGYSPDDYEAQADYNFLEEERTKEYGCETYLMERYLAMKAAIVEGDMERVKVCRESLETRKYKLDDIHDKVGVSFMHDKYRPLLFLCLDHQQYEIALYLIDEGATVRIYAPMKANEQEGEENEPVSLHEAACFLETRKDVVDMIKMKEYQRQLVEEAAREKHLSSAKSDGRQYESGRSTSLSSYMETDINGNGKQKWNKVRNTEQFIQGAGVAVQRPSVERSGSSACAIL